eukprot:1159169-Pelagomonas_calceolata.AAC.3
MPRQLLYAQAYENSKFRYTKANTVACLAYRVGRKARGSSGTRKAGRERMGSYKQQQIAQVWQDASATEV